VHFQVAEKALTLWNNEYVLSLVAENLDTILPIVFPALYATAKSHWNRSIQALAYTSLRMFMDIDTELFEETMRNYLQQHREETTMEQLRQEAWEAVVDVVKKKEGGELNEDQLPQFLQKKDRGLTV